jgi:hypothetical protein
MARRLGWIGPAIIVVAVGVAALGAWTILKGRPVAGDPIDTLRVDDRTVIVVRDERGGTRNFIELRRDDETVWEALVPTYGGRPGAPGIAWNDVALSVRVVRDSHAEIFALAFADGTKLGGFRLAPNHGPVVLQASGPVTVTDHVRAYEIVAGPGWHQITAFELASGQPLWREDLGPQPVDDAGVRDGSVWVRQGTSMRRFRASDGAESIAKSS